MTRRDDGLLDGARTPDRNHSGGIPHGDAAEPGDANLARLSTRSELLERNLQACKDEATKASEILRENR